MAASSWRAEVVKAARGTRIARASVLKGLSCDAAMLMVVRRQLGRFDVGVVVKCCEVDVGLKGLELVGIR